LWVNFPALMWRMRRNGLRRLAEQELTTLELNDRADDAPLLFSAEDIEVVAQETGVAEAGDAVCRDGRRRRGRGLGTKRLAFEAALAQQVRCGDGSSADARGVQVDECGELPVRVVFGDALSNALGGLAPL